MSEDIDLLTEEEIEDLYDKWKELSPHRLRTDSKLNKRRVQTKYFRDLRDLLSVYLERLEKVD